MGKEIVEETEVGRTKVFIIGAFGRDFQNFLTLYKNKPAYDVVAFVAASQIDLGSTSRVFPASLSGYLYEVGIPIVPEDRLGELVKKEISSGHKVVVELAYSDIPHKVVSDYKNKVRALGARFIGPTKNNRCNQAMIKSIKPVIAVTASRTGGGKSAVSRSVMKRVQGMGLRIVAIRHPMPYGDLAKQAVQRFETYEDLIKHKCTLEEMEEYEPHIEAGNIVYAGVDYEAILREAEKEADVILWDGGNNDLPFYKPDLWITVVDPFRPKAHLTHPHGMGNVRNADIIIVNKVKSAGSKLVNRMHSLLNEATLTRGCRILEGNLELSFDQSLALQLKQDDKSLCVAIVEDGPTLTHGEMRFGAGILGTRELQALIEVEAVDPVPYLKGTLIKTFEKYPHLRRSYLLPNMGYTADEISSVRQTIEAMPIDMIVSGTPIDLAKILKTNIPILWIKYDFEISEDDRYILEEALRILTL